MRVTGDLSVNACSASIYGAAPDLLGSGFVNHVNIGLTTRGTKFAQAPNISLSYHFTFLLSFNEMNRMESILIITLDSYHFTFSSRHHLSFHHSLFIIPPPQHLFIITSYSSLFQIDSILSLPSLFSFTEVIGVKHFISPTLSLFIFSFLSQM